MEGSKGHHHHKPHHPPEQQSGAISEGTKVWYHSEHGDWLGFVSDYVEGREEGDYLIVGFTGQDSGGAGDTFRRWSVFGTEQGAFSVAK